MVWVRERTIPTERPPLVGLIKNKRPKLQWPKNPGQINGDDMNIVRLDFLRRTRKYMKDRSFELKHKKGEMNLCSGVNTF
jgi:hypothetical protein